MASEDKKDQKKERGDHVRLGELASIRSGLVLSRKQVKENGAFCYPALNMRSMDVHGHIDLEQLDRVETKEQLKPEYFTRRGDIVVKISTPYTSTLIDESTAGILIPSNFLIIRTQPGKLLPEYFYWLLNTTRIKNDLGRNSNGSVIGSVKAAYFSDLDIVPLPLEKQEKIAKLDRLAKREAELLRRLADEKEKYYDRVLSRIQTDMRRGNQNDDEK